MLKRAVRGDPRRADPAAGDGSGAPGGTRKKTHGEQEVKSLKAALNQRVWKNVVGFSGCDCSSWGVSPVVLTGRIYSDE